eukprot:CAMPEP_0172490002 /NCGR_PEP_ID=MMETSP1066-20121228/20315_1 /TAXON_ID=671091 /ORGANISM="Coscinodiscus wailesii, Strain CCMP2513" /LENGTH=48 /DNA_ID= /DNA_START= /DNA_END= /DNA_ORIENTATION=
MTTRRATDPPKVAHLPTRSSSPRGDENATSRNYERNQITRDAQYHTAS